jgi:hypothetical protein
MSFGIIITHNVNEQVGIQGMFVVAVANSVLTINCVTMKLFGPSIIHINKVWQAV